MLSVQVLRVEHTYIPTYIHIYIKMNALTQVIIFFQFNALKIFNTINAGVGLGLATPLTTAKELRLFRRRTYLQAHQTGDFSDIHSNFTSAPGASQTSVETVAYLGWGASVEQQWTAVRRDVVRPYVGKNGFVHSCQPLYCARSACSSIAHTNVPAHAVLGYIKALYHIQTQMKLQACDVVVMSSVKSQSYKKRRLKLL